ncbi:hypothetical protein XAXN_14800 [Xanthomonas axonopodis]|uniref:Uncharacterized protein n=1 Tax=Xanthomonas axonopodis TaxID=53413 RepID=A0A0P6V974_9XANT|nr:hypothetical protein XAXN_14800 [Xanthomonas axonopodis]
MRVRLQTLATCSRSDAQRNRTHTYMRIAALGTDAIRTPESQLANYIAVMQCSICLYSARTCGHELSRASAAQRIRAPAHLAAGSLRCFPRCGASTATLAHQRTPAA